MYTLAPTLSDAGEKQQGHFDRQTSINDQLIGRADILESRGV